MNKPDENKPNGRGGARERSGPAPKFGVRLVSVHGRVLPVHKEKIREIGNGKLGRGLRRILGDYFEEGSYEPVEDASEEDAES